MDAKATAFLSRLDVLLGSSGWLTGEQMGGYCLDQRGRYQGRALAVARPQNTGEVAAVVQLCRELGVAIVPQGGNTSLCGGATPDASGSELILSLSRMNRVLAVDADNNTLTVEAGVTLTQAQQAARVARRLFPANWAAADTCQIGGALATNAGGLNVLRYGNMRELTLGLEVVLADGSVWNGVRGLRKDNSGYDLKQVFIGSEGTLGIITQAVLRLFPLPTARATALVGVAGPTEALALLHAVQGRMVDRVTSFELLSKPCFELLDRHFPQLVQPLRPMPAWAVLLELSDGGDSADLINILVEALVDLGMEDAVVAQSPQQERELWQLREMIPEAQRREGVSIKHDIGVPVSAIPTFLRDCSAKIYSQFPTAQVVAFGHLGDGNLHYNIFFPDHSKAVYVHEPQVNEIVYACVADHEGTFSAEHGVGQLKRMALARYRSPTEVALMHSIKTALDPEHLMNPGKVLPDAFS